MIQYIEKIPTAAEYSYLTESVGWGTEREEIAEAALKNTFYSICAMDGEKIVGYARLIGDQVLFLYVQDVMVLPQYQGQHIGSQLMERILCKVKEQKAFSPNLRTYLGASRGREDFYRRFGFVTRSDADLGAGMVLF